MEKNAMSRTYADTTCGFLPLHLYEGTELDRAMDICHAINLFAMEGMGFGAKADVEPLRDLTLREMLDAVDMVEAWNDRPKMNGFGYTCCMVPAERLTAAVYTLLHFFDRSACDQDGDHIPVRFRFRSWGTDYVHFLLVGNREAQEFEVDEEEDEAA